jgi:hypothetical protein
MGTMTYERTRTEVLERARVVHLLACSGAPYADLRYLAEDDPAVVEAAIDFRSTDRLDYSVMSHETVVYRLEGLLRELVLQAA